MSDPGLPTTPEGWGGLVVGIAGALVAIRKGLQKIGVLEPKFDYERMAEAFFKQKAAEDARHRDAIVDGLHEVAETVRQVNAATTANIRAVLELYGKDVSEIRDAQERADRQLDSIAKALGDLRVEVAKR